MHLPCEERSRLTAYSPLEARADCMPRHRKVADTPGGLQFEAQLLPEQEEWPLSPFVNSFFYSWPQLPPRHQRLLSPQPKLSARAACSHTACYNLGSSTSLITSSVFPITSRLNTMGHMLARSTKQRLSLPTELLELF